MFNKDFYPTPTNLIEQLLKPYYFTDYRDRERLAINGTLLEPQAGAGDIVNYIFDNNQGDCEIHALEIEPKLQSILQSIDNEKFSFLGNDFLNFKSEDYYDYIIMNPPFSNGEDHLLKAIEIADSTKIACILNAETIKNPYSNKRKRLIQEIKKYNGVCEFVQNAFVDAERKTNVEVVLIWLEVEKNSNKFKFDFISENELDLDFDLDFTDQSIAKKDFIGNFKINAELVKKAYEDKIKADAKFEHYLKNFLQEDKLYDSDINNYIKKDGSAVNKYNYLNKKLKAFMWRKCIYELDIQKYMSSKVLDNFDKFIKQQAKMAFSKENVFSLFYMIMNNKDKILNDSIIDVFDKLTSHGYTENRMYVETWKTNDAYKLNKRFITPTTISYGRYMSSYDLKKFGDRFSLYCGYQTSFLGDLDKILCYITGKSLSTIYTIEKALSTKFEDLGKVYTGDKFDSSCESEFFKIKFYKKGTIHLEFKEIDLWNEFNYRACKDKNWIPNDELKKHNSKYKKEDSKDETIQVLKQIELEI